MVRSSHHLPLPSLPPPRVVLCSPFVSLLPSPTAEEVRRRARRRGIAASHLSRRPGPAERAYQYVNESPTGTTITPLIPHLSVYIDTILGDRYLACRPHFFKPPYSSLTRLLFECNPRWTTRSLATFQLRIRHRRGPCLPISETHVSSPSWMYLLADRTPP